jgi:hypothetical protein
MNFVQITLPVDSHHSVLGVSMPTAPIRSHGQCTGSTSTCSSVVTLLVLNRSELMRRYWLTSSPTLAPHMPRPSCPCNTDVRLISVDRQWTSIHRTSCWRSSLTWVLELFLVSLTLVFQEVAILELSHQNSIGVSWPIPRGYPKHRTFCSFHCSLQLLTVKCTHNKTRF